MKKQIINKPHPPEFVFCESLTLDLDLYSPHFVVFTSLIDNIRYLVFERVAKDGYKIKNYYLEVMRIRENKIVKTLYETYDISYGQSIMKYYKTNNKEEFILHSLEKSLRIYDVQNNFFKKYYINSYLHYDVEVLFNINKKTI